MNFRYTPEQAREFTLEALRSGQYTKTIGRLKRGDCFCALGVLTDVFRVKEGIGEWVFLEKNFIYGDIFGFHIKEKKYSNDLATGHLIFPVCKWYNSYRMEGPIWNLNDSEHKSFSEIADWLEEYWSLQQQVIQS